MSAYLATRDLPDHRRLGAVRIGAVIDDSYRILGLLGSGGMGEVYEAEHLRLGAKVALKVLRAPEDEDAARRLVREARLTAALNTDHVVRVSDCGTLGDGSPYVVMERLRGEDLRLLLARQHQLSVQQALRIALQICAGLSALHAAGVIHRDLKPANVFVLNGDRSACRCKLLDLGIARSLHGDTSSSLSVTGSIRYMAPEQLADGKNVAEHADVYAAGVILYQCLTGTLPHQGQTVEEIMFSILNRQARPVSELRPEVSTPLATLVMRAIKRNASARPGSASEFAQALSAFLVPATPTSFGPGALDATQPELLPLSSKVTADRRVRLWGTSAVGVLGVSLLLLKFALQYVPSTTASVPASQPSVPTPVVARMPTDARSSLHTPSAAAPLTEQLAVPETIRTHEPVEPRRVDANRVQAARRKPVRSPPGSLDADLSLEKNPYAE